jgi:hypothetical protein
VGVVLILIFSVKRSKNGSDVVSPSQICFLRMP